MLTPLTGLDEPDLVRFLREQFGAPGERPVFVPAGEDSWAYRTDHLWVSVRRDLRGHVPAAYAAAYDLHRAGLDFVVAPLAGRDGAVVHQVQGFPVVVFRYLDAEPLTAVDAADRPAGEVCRLLDAVHASPPPAGLPVEDYRPPFLAELSWALAAPVPRDGPYGRRLDALLRAHAGAIATARQEFGDLARSCERSRRPTVLTHGEPSAQNVLRAGTGLLLVDWGAAMLGPPERDWFHVRRTLGPATAGPDCDPKFLRCYELRWFLSEITEYAVRFRHDHGGDAEDAAMWSRLVTYLPENPDGSNSDDSDCRGAAQPQPGRPALGC